VTVEGTAIFPTGAAAQAAGLTVPVLLPCRQFAIVLIVPVLVVFGKQLEVKASFVSRHTLPVAALSPIS